MTEAYKCKPCNYDVHKEVKQADPCETKKVCCEKKYEHHEPLSQDDLRPVPPGRPPCYLPQPNEDVLLKKDALPMDALGPWATGRVDWGPLAGLTGTRPVVQKYSITRYSDGEWRQRNQDNINANYMAQHQSNLVTYNAEQCMEKTRKDADKEQEDNKKRLSQRASDIHRWKCELERAIEAAAEELRILQIEQNRLKQAMCVLNIPEAIVSEFLDIRTSRLEPDLVRDEVEKQLIREMSLTAEVRELFNRTLIDLNGVISEQKAAKERLEADWSDKLIAHRLEATSISLTNKTTTIKFVPGSTRLPDNQSSPQHWEYFTSETLNQAETTRQNAVTFRATLDAVLTNAARDLRTQADVVDTALAKRIACTDELKNKLDIELNKVLKHLVEAEKLIITIQQKIRNMDYVMKVVQTRLQNKLARPRVDGCREFSQLGLIDEVKHTSERVAALTVQLNKAIEMKALLLQTRSDLERELMIKLKSLQIDRTRGQLIRSHYPSTTALTGH